MRFLLFLFLLSAVTFNSLSQDKIKIEDILNLAALFQENMEYRRAIGILESSAKSDKDERIKKFLLRLYYLSGENDKALKMLTKLKGKGWQELIYQGLIYEELDNSRLAVKSYLDSLKYKKTSIALYRLGKIFYRGKNYKKAKEFFSDVISYDPSIRLAYYYLGDCFLNISRNSQAYRYISKAAMFYPQSKIINNKLRLVKQKLGEEFFAQKRKVIEKKRREVRFVSYQKEENIPYVKVSIAKDLDKFTFKGKNFIIADGRITFEGRRDKFYTFYFKQGRISLYNYKGEEIYKRLEGPVDIYPQRNNNSFPFYILDVTYGESDFWHKRIDRAYRGNLRVLAQGGGLTLVNILSLEEYLYGVLPSEIPPQANFEAIKAQAVAARTIAFKNIGRHKKEGFDFGADVHTQVYRGFSSESPSTTKAVKETRGEIIAYKDKPIDAFYHSNSGGCLRADIFGRMPYLVSKFDSRNKDRAGLLSPYEEESWFVNPPQAFGSFSSNFRWQRIYDREDFLLAWGFKLKDLKDIFPLEKGDCFHYNGFEVTAVNKKITLKGDLPIRDYWDKLRSSAFKLEVKFSSSQEPQMLIFWGAGFGHGVGLSQEGAIDQGENGYGYKDILKHYYPHTQIRKLY